MKTKYTPLIASLIFGMAFLNPTANAQDAEEPSRIMIDAKVTLNGKKAEDLKVIVYQDNKPISSRNIRKNSFDMALDLNQSYTLQVSKEGYKTYRMFIDGRVSSNLDRDQKLKMEIDLPNQGPILDPYFDEFPDAIMSWDGRTEMFTERAHYSAHIHEKKSPLSAATD